MVSFQSDVTTLGTIAPLIAQALQRYEIDPEPLFKIVYVDYQQIHDPEFRIQTLRMQKLWKLCIDETEDESFGLIVAEQMQPVALQGLGFAWLASDTLYDAFSRLARFDKLLNTLLEVNVEETDQSFDLYFSGTERWPDFVHAATDCALAIIVNMCRITFGRDIAPQNVHMQRDKPESTRVFDSVFRCPIRYGTEKLFLSFDKSLVKQPLPMANPELARQNDQTVIQYLSRFEKNSIIMKVRANIIDKLPAGTPDQESIASSLNLSLRSLQRKLKDEETSYRNLLEDTRRQLAMEYIKESHRTISEITFLLGFTEPSNFTRAFKRWTGHSPAEFRQLANSN